MSAKLIIEAIYGRLLTLESPVKYADMTDDERLALIAQHEDGILADLEALELVIDQARCAGIAAAVSAFRNSEGIDTAEIDDIVASLYDPRKGRR